jgi:Tol biopolymer transport system component
MRFFGLCLILIVIGLALACGGNAPAETTSTQSTDQTVKCTIFATREGLVGRTTANGHVIQPTDRFAALPSKLVLARAGGNEFQVRITYKNTTVTVPVWDVGPWNTEDNYWDPSEQRLRWKDLPQCRPQAQAAYEAKYNDGKDQSGRQVKNPAGIDLSDGTWTALGMTDNDRVVVEYLWTKGPSSIGTGASAPVQRPTAKQNPSTTPTPPRVRTVAFAAKECRREGADRSIKCDRQQNIYTANDDGSRPSKVAEAGTSPVWSPDGNKIAFVSMASGDAGAIYVVNKDGTNMTRLTNAINGLSQVLWTTDGSGMIYFTGFPFGDSVHIVTVMDKTDRQLGTKKNLSQVMGFTVVSIASGIKSAYWETTARGGFEERRDLLVDNLDGTTPTKITTAVFSIMDILPKIFLSSDGRYLVYTGPDRVFMVGDTDGKSTRVFAPEFKSERFRDESRVDPPFTWSPTSDKVAYQTRDKTIYVQNIVTGEEQQISRGKTFAWSPDGSKIAYNGPNKQDISVFDLATSKTTTVAQLPTTTIGFGGIRTDGEVDARIIWSTDGKKLLLKNLADQGNYNRETLATSKPLGGYIINADGTGGRITLDNNLYLNSLLQLVGDIVWAPND